MLTGKLGSSKELSPSKHGRKNASDSNGNARHKQRLANGSKTFGATALMVEEDKFPALPKVKRTPAADKGENSAKTEQPKMPKGLASAKNVSDKLVGSLARLRQAGIADASQRRHLAALADKPTGTAVTQQQ